MTLLTTGEHTLISDGAPAGLVLAVTWNAAQTNADLAVFRCTSRGTVLSQQDLLSALTSNMASPDRTTFVVQDYAGGISQRAQVMLDMIEMPPTAERIDVLLVAPEDGQTLSHVRDIRVEIFDSADGQSYASYDLAVGGLCSCLVLGRLSKSEGSWKFEALADLYPRDFASQAREYGITVAP